MELLFVIVPLLIIFVVGYVVISIQDWVTDARFYRERHLRELKLAMMQLEHPEFFSRTHDVSADEIRKALDIYKTSKVTNTLPTGEVEVIVFGEEMADEVIKEARERHVGDIS